MRREPLNTASVVVRLWWLPPGPHLLEGGFVLDQELGAAARVLLVLHTVLDVGLLQALGIEAVSR